MEALDFRGFFNYNDNVVIQFEFGNQSITPERTRVFRNVIKNTGLAEKREAFYALAPAFKWGKMWQLKGKEKILLAKHGELK